MLKKTCMLFLDLITLSTSTPIDDLKPGEWYEVPGSHLKSVAPSGWSGNVIAPWSGGAFDSKRNQLLVWGGGHGDYSGNELYAFNLDSLKWFRLTEPSVPYDFSAGCSFAVNSDSQPISRHTYNGLDYMANVDMVFEQGGYNWPCAWGDTVTWLFDFGRNQWIRGGHADSHLGDPTMSVYDPVDGFVWTRSGNCTQTYNPVTRRWAGAGWDWNDPPGFKIAAVEPDRRLFVGLGNGTIVTCTLANTDKDSIHRYRVDSTSGDTTMKTFGSPGFVWDPVGKVFVGWSGGATVYTLDMAVKRWTKVVAASSNTVVPSPACRNGTYGRFRYSPKNDVFVVVNSIDENVFVYRMNRLSTTAERNIGFTSGGISVSPNPFVADTRVGFENPDRVAELSLYELSGRLVRRISGIESPSVRLNTEHLAVGVYILKVKTRVRCHTARIMVVK